MKNRFRHVFCLFFLCFLFHVSSLAETTVDVIDFIPNFTNAVKRTKEEWLSSADNRAALTVCLDLDIAQNDNKMIAEMYNVLRKRSKINVHFRHKPNPNTRGNYHVHTSEAACLSRIFRS